MPSPNGDGTRGFHYKTKINTNKLASLQQQLRGRGPKPRLLGHHVLAAGQGLTLGVSLAVGTHTAEQQAMALEHGFHDLFFPTEPSEGGQSPCRPQSSFLGKWRDGDN